MQGRISSKKCKNIKAMSKSLFKHGRISFSINFRGDHVNQCVMCEDKDKTSHLEYTTYDKNCQSTSSYDKSWQDTHCVHMWPVKPAMTKSSHMWLAKPAILPSDYKKKNQMKHVSVCDDKNCQSTKSAKSVSDDKNC